MLTQMLRYKRPTGSKSEREFCKRYIEPVFGPYDGNKNYLLKVGDNPNVSFMAHYDTVHRDDGKQSVYSYVAEDDSVILYNGISNCLGADCTTGVYIILKMIEAKIPGYYIIHSEEESGCIGSTKMVNSNPDWIDKVDFAISFDRFGYESIVTHQCGIRTCSDEFAESLESILNLGLVADDTGVYTDSNEYRGVISECTNISVGYFKQHTANEIQDLTFAELLVERLIAANWENLVAKRTPEFEDDWYTNYHSNQFWGEEKEDTIYEFVYQNPQMVTDFLIDCGFSIEDIKQQHYQEIFKT